MTGIESQFPIKNISLEFALNQDENLVAKIKVFLLVPQPNPNPPPIPYYAIAGKPTASFKLRAVDTSINGLEYLILAVDGQNKILKRKSGPIKELDYLSKGKIFLDSVKG